MIELSEEISDFLAKVRKANSRKDKIKGFPGTVFKGIRLDEKLGMFELYSGHNVNSMNSGFDECRSYYIRAENFLPIIRMIRVEGAAVIDSEGVQVDENSNWDHSYASPEDSGKAVIQEGHIRGRLRLDGYVFAEYDLTLSARSKIELKSDIGTIDSDEIKSVITSKR